MRMKNNECHISVLMTDYAIKRLRTYVDSLKSTIKQISQNGVKYFISMQILLMIIWLQPLYTYSLSQNTSWKFPVSRLTLNTDFLVNLEAS